MRMKGSSRGLYTTEDNLIIIKEGGRVRGKETVPERKHVKSIQNLQEENCEAGTSLYTKDVPMFFAKTMSTP